MVASIITKIKLTSYYTTVHQTIFPSKVSPVAVYGTPPEFGFVNLVLLIAGL